MATKRPNAVRIEGDVAYLTLTKGYETAVDVADLPKVQQYRWHATGQRDHVYVVGYTSSRHGHRRRLSLHRYLLDAPPDLVVDHRDSDGLNNRRENIRLVTANQNLQNRNKSNSRTGIRGITSYCVRGQWTYYRAAVDATHTGHRLYSKTFPYTPEGLVAAEAWVIAKRLEVFTHSDGR